MPIKVTCPKCGGVLHAPDDAGGKRGRCPTCATVLTIPAEGARSAAADLPPPASAPMAASAEGNPFRAGGSSHRPGLMETTDVNPPESRSVPPTSELRPGGTYQFKDISGSPGRMPPAAPVVPPTTSRIPEPNRSTFTANTAEDETEAARVRGWKRVRRGLGILRFAVFFAFLAPAVVAGLIAYEQYGSPLPDQPGVLGIEGTTLAQEIRFAAVVVPALLSVLFTLFGRMSLVGAPRQSMARGLFRFSALATIFAIAGLVLAAFPTMVELLDGTEPTTQMMPPETQSGAFQRFGLPLGVLLAVLAETWFLAGLSKVGASLRHRPTAGRSGGMLILGGLALIAVVTAAIGYFEYPGMIQQWWVTNAQSQWDQVGEHKPVARAGAAVVLGLVIAVLYGRMIGAGRRATRDWLERNAPAG